MINDQKYMTESSAKNSCEKNASQNATLPLFGRIGVVGRFRPLHNGSASLLDAICESAGRAIIAVGSSNKYDARNPFTADETQEMINTYLAPRHKNYEIVQIPDYGHVARFADGKRWLTDVEKHFGQIDCFVTGNPFVEKLVHDTYMTLHPNDLIHSSHRSMTKGTAVRVAMAKDANWQDLVPQEVAKYISTQQLDTRLRREFADEILRRSHTGYERFETADEERVHVVGV